MDVCPNRWELRKGTHYLEIWVLALFAGLGYGRAGFITSKVLRWQNASFYKCSKSTYGDTLLM